MAIFPADVFQLPLPAIIYLIPPSHPVQWILRSILLLYITFVAIPLICFLVPVSVLLYRNSHTRPLAPLPIHPHNLPPLQDPWTSLRRGTGIYIVSSVAWAITSVGNAPPTSDEAVGRLARATLWIVEHILPSQVKLEIQEIIFPPVPKEVRIGVLGLKNLDIQERKGYFLRRKASSTGSLIESERVDGDGTGKAGKKVILFLAGGGYVTGLTLSHPVIYSLMRRLPPAYQAEGHALFAPSVRKSLDKARSFPIPLLDALAGYIYLRDQGYQPDNITILGDSAGAGLSWSLISTLCTLDSIGMDLGIPGRIVLISPWLSLPPFSRPDIPDLVDEPMLLNAARCYLGRFPILKHRPDPFSSEWSIWYNTLSQAVYRINSLPITSEEISKPENDFKRDTESVSDWLDETAFIRMSSHHPLISPTTNTGSPFVRGTLETLKAHRSKLLINCGTAEWFYGSAIALAKAASKVGVDIELMEEKGGFHSECCTFPAEWGGSSHRLVEKLVDWLD